MMPGLRDSSSAPPVILEQVPSGDNLSEFAVVDEDRPEHHNVNSFDTNTDDEKHTKVDKKVE